MPLLDAVDLNIISDGDDRSILVVKVYQKNSIGKDKLIGSLTETIGGVLQKLKDGGTVMIYVASFIDTICTIKVFEATLGKNTPDESGSGFTIKFLFTAEPRKSGDAMEHQATDAVTRAAKVIGSVSSTPMAMGLVTDAVSSITAKVQGFESTWGVLLERMALFNTIVSDIVAVFDVHLLDVSVSEADIDPPVHFSGLVCYFSCESGELIAHYPYCC